MTDRELAQLICAFRIAFPEVGIVLSTRERAALRDALAPLGITMMSAGSHTEPGGYTHQGTDELHRTVRGRIVAPEFENGEDILATGQFEISDARSPSEVADALRRSGFEPVWNTATTAVTAAAAVATPASARYRRRRAGTGRRCSCSSPKAVMTCSFRAWSRSAVSRGALGGAIGSGSIEYPQCRPGRRDAVT